METTNCNLHFSDVVAKHTVIIAEYMYVLNLTEFSQDENLERYTQIDIKDILKYEDEEEFQLLSSCVRKAYIRDGCIYVLFRAEDSLKRFCNRLIYDEIHRQNSTIYDENDYDVCEDCGEVFCRNYLVSVNGDYYCDDCVSNHAFRCEHCGEWHSFDEEATVIIGSGIDDTEEWCEHCRDVYASQCDDCGEWVADAALTCVSGAGDICPRCIRSDRYVACGHCGEIVCYDDAHWDEDDDCFYCDSCYESRSSRHIRSYHNNPTLKYHVCEGETDNRKYIGTEIETDSDERDSVRDRCDFTHDFGEQEKYIYQMHDGSLGDYGIECITMPMSYEFWKQFKFKEWFDGLIERDARAHDTTTCGLHVHLSREWLGTTDYRTQCVIVGRMRQFLADNANDVKRFARRSSEQWCHYTHTFDDPKEKVCLTKTEVDAKYYENVVNDSGCHSSRYRSVNNENSSTIEFRIFKGTLKENTYRASVEFCLRLVDYIITHEDDVISWRGFITYKPLPECMRVYMTERRMDLFE